MSAWIYDVASLEPRWGTMYKRGKYHALSSLGTGAIARGWLCEIYLQLRVTFTHIIVANNVLSTTEKLLRSFGQNAHGTLQTIDAQMRQCILFLFLFFAHVELSWKMCHELVKSVVRTGLPASSVKHFNAWIHVTLH